ncbi:MAG TPA: DUF302 domain-containing protein [Bdellovibrio sp.]|uniref:DUF302 domain-containing protein n=1 Tax=Bdellovibrio sp. TaxID=28201 RepID=UPI002EE19240
MSNLALTKEVSGKIEDVVAIVTDAIKPAGFGVLTRIDFDKKLKEKIGETIKPCVILGACNPSLAFKAYQQSSDAALLIPCNIVLTEISPGKVRIEAIKPTKMLGILPAIKLSDEVQSVELALERCFESLNA